MSTQKTCIFLCITTCYLNFVRVESKTSGFVVAQEQRVSLPYRPNGEEQPCFRGIFAKASKLSKGIDDDHDQDSIISTAANQVNTQYRSMKDYEGCALGL